MSQIVAQDHSYAAQRNNNYDDQDDRFHDIDFFEIFHLDGSWHKTHIRHLVHVLDSFRISHQAYHELRMVSKGHLPPIRRLSIERK